MEFLALPYHNIDPEIFRIGPVVLRWYSLAYILGILLGWWYLAKLSMRKHAPYTRQDADDFVLWATFGIILGGRLGYVLFYRPGFYADNPAEILQVWDGGMSFHGGLLGVILAIWWFTKRRDIPIRAFADYIACVVPIGLFFGRLANFINGELWGAPSNLPWAMVFPSGGPEPRHPTQVYEALLEGVVIFLVLNWLLRRTAAVRMPGLITGSFFVLYGVFRYLIEFVRVPDAHLGYLGGIISMGQILSLPMIAFGLYLILSARQKAQKKGA